MRDCQVSEKGFRSRPFIELSPLSDHEFTKIHHCWRHPAHELKWSQYDAILAIPIFRIKFQLCLPNAQFKLITSTFFHTNGRTFILHDEKLELMLEYCSGYDPRLWMGMRRGDVLRMLENESREFDMEGFVLRRKVTERRKFNDPRIGRSPPTRNDWTGDYDPYYYLVIRVYAAREQSSEVPVEQVASSKKLWKKLVESFRKTRVEH